MSRWLRVVDLETTGNSFTDGGVVEIGWQDLRQNADGTWVLDDGPQAVLIDPGRPISPATSAIHHLIDEDVAGAPHWLDAAPGVLLPSPAPAALVAHRAAFEQRWCAQVLHHSLPWICTWKTSLRVWPDAPSHSNQGLRYWRRPSGLDRAASLPAHRAGPDAYVTAHHLRDMLAVVELETLLAWSAEPGLLTRVPYGKLRGRNVRDLTDEMLASLDERPDTDLGFTVRHERLRREQAAPAQVIQDVLL